MGFTRVSELFGSKPGRRSVSLDQISFLNRLRRGQGKICNPDDDTATSTSADNSTNDQDSKTLDSEPPQLTLAPILPTVFPILPDSQPFAGIIERSNNRQQAEGSHRTQIDPSIDSFRQRSSSSEFGGIWSHSENDTNTTTNSSADGIGGDGNQIHSNRPLQIIFHSPDIVPPRHPPLCARDPEKSILRTSQTDPNIQGLYDRTAASDTAANTSRNLLLTNGNRNKARSEEDIDILHTSARALRRLSLPPISWDPINSEPNTEEEENISKPSPTSASDLNLARGTIGNESQTLGKDTSPATPTNTSPTTPVKGGGNPSSNPPSPTVTARSMISGTPKSNLSKKTVRFDRIDVHTYTPPPPFRMPMVVSRSNRGGVERNELKDIAVGAHSRDEAQGTSPLFSPSEYGKLFGQGN